MEVVAAHPGASCKQKTRLSKGVWGGASRSGGGGGGGLGSEPPGVTPKHAPTLFAALSATDVVRIGAAQAQVLTLLAVQVQKCKC
jgi:hypothetical protein